MGEHIGLAHAALQFVFEAQARVAVAPARNAGLPKARVGTRVLGGECGRAQHHRAGPVGDLPAVLAARAGLDDGVGLVVVGKAQGIKLPVAGLRQRVVFGVCVVQLCNTVQVPAVQPIALFIGLGHQAKGCRPHVGASYVFAALPRGGVLVLRSHIAGQVLELFYAQHQHAVVAARLNFGHGAEHRQRRRRTGPFVPHGGHAPQLGHHLGHHRAQVRLLALQFAKGIAHVDALHLLRFDGRCLQRSQCGLAQHV